VRGLSTTQDHDLGEKSEREELHPDHDQEYPEEEQRAVPDRGTADPDDGQLEADRDTEEGE
jgi:hypothetical protein